MNSALQLPEIVECILGYVGLTSISELKHCLTVNKLWFHESARVMWKIVTISRLSKIGDLERLQVYANFVTQLSDHSGVRSSYTIPSQLKLPVLQNVYFMYPNFFEELLHPLLVPSLSRLVLYKNDVSDQFLLDVIERCPELDEFAFAESPKLTTAGLQKFLVMTRCPSLTLRHMSDCLGWETLCKAAENKFIKELGIEKCDEYAFSQTRKLVKNPFPSLTWFNSMNFEGSMEDILRITKTLKRVNLNVQDFNTVTRFLKIPECSIEHLHIGAKYGNLNSSGLIELAKYSNLKRVDLWVDRPLSVADQFVDDKWIDEFTRFTPSLDSIVLVGIPITITSKGLSAIGRNCPDVTELQLWFGQKADVPVDKNDFSPALPCLFPKLRSMGAEYSCFSKGGMNHEEIMWHFPLVYFTEGPI